jgi:serine/threonine protein kinase
MAVKCPKCQTDNPSDSKYCKECATPLFTSRDIDFSHTKTLETPVEELPRGTTFAGRYEIIEELGQGGMGKVYKVFDKEVNAKVALKLIKPEVAADRNTIERFRNELRIARDISHKNVCRMYDLGREAENYYITMEYVPGEDLKSFIRRARRLDVGTAISIAKQVCEGLVEAHRLGVVHRDLKPGNIMIDRDGNAKVMDFGIARSLKAKGITGTGVMIGTPEYMSPEQVDGKEADERADIYSLGIILYEMVTGTVPFEGDTAFAVALKHKTEQPESPKRLNPQIPDDLSRLILKCLEKNKDARYQGAGEVVSELTRIEQGLPTTERAVPKRKAITSKEITVKFSLRKIFIPALALGVIAAVAALLVLLPKRQPLKQPIIPSHKQLTFTGDAGYPAISPDGKFIAYVTSQPDKGPGVWVQDMASGHSIEVFSGELYRNLRWTPDCSEIAVIATKNSKRGTFLVSRLGGPSRYLDYFRSIAWSPEGSQFAGINMTSKSINIINKLTGKSTSFSLIGPILYILDIDWSPSGDRLLVLTQNKENKYSILMVKTDGSQQNMVIEDNISLSSPRWSSKGDAIFYLKGQFFGSLWKLPISRASGKPKKSPSLVLSGVPMGGVFSLSADGKYFLYTRESQFSNLWLAKIEGSEKNQSVKTQQLTSGTSLNLTSSISPDGKLIAFSRGNGETLNIFVMPIEGGNPIQLTFFDSKNFSPVWSPDGTEIAFGSTEGGKSKVWKVSSQGGRSYQFAKTASSDEYSKIVWAPDSHIMYQKAGNRNFMILDPKTEEETPLVKDESVGFISSPVYSPDRKKVVVYWNRQPTVGFYIISLEDFSEKLLRKGIGTFPHPLSWSPDGKWVYASEVKSGKVEYLMIEVESGQTKPLPVISFTIEGETYNRLIDGKPEICEVVKTQSDVWVIDNFDRIIK